MGVRITLRNEALHHYTTERSAVHIHYFKCTIVTSDTTLSRVNTLTRDDKAILFVRLAVCPLRSGIIWKRLNVLPRCILVLRVSNSFAKFRRGHSLRALNTGWA